ncbi:hypothetical protein ADK88_09955 [Streptomyces sp. NRRL F-2295]|nr:hypothetical protein ADK88_09955 [Streptomyces sp. NRRL F-2295]
MQGLGEQRVRAEHIGQLGLRAALHHRLPYPAEQRAVGAREQRDDDGGRAGGLGDLTPDGDGLLVACDALGGGAGEDGGEGRVLGVVAVHVADHGVQAGQLGTGDADHLFGQAARGRGGGTGNGEDEGGRALGCDHGLRAAVPSGLARSRHSYRQAGSGPSGGAHGAACYWFCLPLCSGRVRSSVNYPLMSDEG